MVSHVTEGLCRIYLSSWVKNIRWNADYVSLIKKWKWVCFTGKKKKTIRPAVKVTLKKNAIPTVPRKQNPACCKTNKWVTLINCFYKTHLWLCNCMTHLGMRYIWRKGLKTHSEKKRKEKRHGLVYSGFSQWEWSVTPSLTGRQSKVHFS